MNTEEVKRAWFGAIRDSADSTGKELKEKTEMTPLQAVKLDILLRQYLCDGLEDDIKESENATTKEIKNLQKDVNSELIEDAIAGIWSETENMEIAMFLYACTEGVRTEDLFFARLKEILPDDDLEGIPQKLMVQMNRDMMKFSNFRKKRWLPKVNQNEDDPPPWLDEFEYIDWVMTH